MNYIDAVRRRRQFSRHDGAAAREQYHSWRDVMVAMDVFRRWVTEQEQAGRTVTPANLRFRIWSVGPNKWLCTRTDYPSPATRWRTEK